MPDTRDARGSVPVFQGIWEQMRAEQAEPEFNEQERLFAERKVEALDAILPPPPATVLECGSGTGEVSAYLAGRGYACTLLDAAPAALDLARTRFERAGLTAAFVAGDVYALPFPDDHFDIVTSFGLLEHFRDVDVVIAEMVRVLRPGGFFFADIVTERFSVQTLGNVFNAAVRLVYYGARGRPRHGVAEARKLFRPDFYENDYAISRYRAFMERAGLRDVVIRGNRPFPVLTMPGPVEHAYVGLMHRSWGFWRRFDEAGNVITNALGAGWWAWGTKG